MQIIIFGNYIFLKLQKKAQNLRLNGYAVFRCNILSEIEELFLLSVFMELSANALFLQVQFRFDWLTLYLEGDDKCCRTRRASCNTVSPQRHACLKSWGSAAPDILQSSMGPSNRDHA